MNQKVRQSTSALRLPQRFDCFTNAQRTDDEIRLCGLWTKDKTQKKSSWKYAEDWRIIFCGLWTKYKTHKNLLKTKNMPTLPKDRLYRVLWFVLSDCPCYGFFLLLHVLGQNKQRQRPKYKKNIIKTVNDQWNNDFWFLLSAVHQSAPLVPQGL